MPVIPLEKLTLELPFCGTVPAGFPSPADDYLEERLSLDKYIIKNLSSPFFLKVEGLSMKASGERNRGGASSRAAVGRLPRAGELPPAGSAREASGKEVRGPGRQPPGARSQFPVRRFRLPWLDACSARHKKIETIIFNLSIREPAS